MKKTVWALLLLILFLVFSILTLKVSKESIDVSKLPAEITSVLSPDKVEQAIVLSDFKNGWYFFNQIFGFAILAGILWLGFSTRIKRVSEKLVNFIYSLKSPVLFSCILALVVSLMITFGVANDKHLVEPGGLVFVMLWGVIGLFIGKSRHFALQAVYILVFSLILSIVDLPLSYYRDFIIEHHFGLSTQTFAEWIADSVKSGYLGALFTVLIVPLVYWGISKRAKDWWLWIGVAAIPVMVLTLLIVPIYIQPMFNKFEPLKDEALAKRILAEAEQAGISGGRVYQVDMSSETNKVNAYVTGLFGSKRIVLWDTTIKKMTPDEIAFVMAHEMGHYVLNHIWIGIGLFSLTFLVLLFIIFKLIGGLIHRNRDRFGFDSVSDIASLPLLMLMLSLLMFIIDPLTNTFSRHIEHKADEFGLNITHDGATAAQAFVKLANENLSNPAPSAFVEFWLYDHPALKNRIDFCKSYQPQQK